LSRGLRRGMSADDQKALIVWASAYWTRATPSSFAGHEKLFQTFSGKRFRLKTRAEIEGYSGWRQAYEFMDIGGSVPRISGSDRAFGKR
jgi:hypothetical protein